MQVLSRDASIFLGNDDMKKILVVDNHPVMLKFMSNLLEKNGYQVLTAPDGLSALEIFKTYTPDVIFIDMVMPNISGDKLCRIIHSMPQMKDVYLIIISAIVAEEKIDITELGANAYIAKGPFNKMSEHVLDVLDRLDKKAPNDAAQKIIGLEDVYAREITKELLSSKRHSEAILDNISEGVLELTIEGKIIYANPATISLIGIPEEKLLGSNFTALFDDFHQFRVKELLDLIDDGPQKIPEDLPVILKGKQVSLNILPINDEGHKSVIVIFSDISKRKQIEAKLQRAQKMEAIGNLAGGVAHDLNNVLSGLVSYPELILMDLSEDHPLRKPLLIIQSSGEKAAAIVQDLLTLARRGIAVSEVVNLNNVIFEYLTSHEYDRLRLFHPEIEVETNVEQDLLNIAGSPVHLYKTVMNLFSNAAEAMSNGGTIFISTENRCLDKPINGYDNVTEGEYVVLSVSDTGIGMSPNDIERIFEPFYTKKVMGKSGTGLGMTVVWGTVKDHTGYIDVQSKEGEGSKFTLYFPVTRKKRAKDKSLLPIEEYMGKGESVLVVDDVEAQREIATGMLRKLGYSVTSVSNGEEAVEYRKNNSADLIVLDMIMDPGINGRETYERIINLHPNQKAIIASGFSETDDVKATQELGAGQYIKKPYTLEEIGIAVRDELKK